MSQLAGNVPTDDDDDGDDEEEVERKLAAIAKQGKREKMKASREALPSFPYRQEFLDAVAANQVLIIVAETGAGKTTQLPQYLLEAGYGNIGKVCVSVSELFSKIKSTFF